jgi:Concanavalin A-like lectin/glucanases superfamily
VACDSGGSNPGSYTGGVTPGQTGALSGDSGTSAAFDGSSGYVKVPESSSLDVGGTFSVEAWVKRGAVGTAGLQVIASKQTRSWSLLVNSANQLVLRQDGSANIAWSWNRVSDTSTWHFVAATKSGSTVHLYVDGVDVTGAVSNETMTNNTLPLVIGESGSDSYFNGQIQEVAVFNQALTSAEIAGQYQLGSGHAPVSTAGGTGATLGTIPTAGSGDPVVAAAGDIACSPSDPDFNNGAGDVNGCQEGATAGLMTGNQLLGAPLSAVLALGDDAYEDGLASEFSAGYDPSWGLFKNITYPVPGNQE